MAVEIISLQESMAPGCDRTPHPWICIQMRICSQTRYLLLYLLRFLSFFNTLCCGIVRFSYIHHCLFVFFVGLFFILFFAILRNYLTKNIHCVMETKWSITNALVRTNSKSKRMLKLFCCQVYIQLHGHNAGVFLPLFYCFFFVTGRSK